MRPYIGILKYLRITNGRDLMLSLGTSSILNLSIEKETKRVTSTERNLFLPYFCLEWKRLLITCIVKSGWIPQKKSMKHYRFFSLSAFGSLRKPRMVPLEY